MLTSERAAYLIPAALGSIILMGLAYRYLITSATPQVASATIAASATILVAVIGTLISKHIEQKREIEKELRERKVQVYQEIMDYWIKAVAGAKKKGALSPEQRAETAKQMVFWSSAQFIKEYGDWVDWDNPEKTADMFELEQLLFLARKEFGFEDTSLGKGDLLRTFLKGVDRRLRAEEA